MRKENAKSGGIGHLKRSPPREAGESGGWFQWGRIPHTVRIWRGSVLLRFPLPSMKKNLLLLNFGKRIRSQA